MSNSVTYKMILAAKSGDGEAMSRILQHYAPYIAVHAKHPFYDEYGNRYEVVDEGIRQRIEAKLLYQIIYRFDPEQLPAGETLEP